MELIPRTFAQATCEYLIVGKYYNVDKNHCYVLAFATPSSNNKMIRSNGYYCIFVFRCVKDDISETPRLSIALTAEDINNFKPRAFYTQECLITHGENDEKLSNLRYLPDFAKFFSSTLDKNTYAAPLGSEKESFKKVLFTPQLTMNFIVDQTTVCRRTIDDMLDTFDADENRFCLYYTYGDKEITAHNKKYNVFYSSFKLVVTLSNVTAMQLRNQIGILDPYVFLFETLEQLKQFIADKLPTLQPIQWVKQPEYIDCVLDRLIKSTV